MGTVPTTEPFEALAEELAASPNLIETLLARHVSDERGYCRTCTTAGTRAIRMPCPLRQLAEYVLTVAGSMR